MEGFLTFWPLNAWHWLALALILLCIEMAAGTFDLLWVGIAAGLTSAFTAFAPDTVTAWQGQLIFFAVASTILFFVGRTLFRNMHENIEEHPTLNKRMAGTVGLRGTVSKDFVDGQGRVKIGDTVWSASSVDGSDLKAGSGIEVEATQGNSVKVRAI